MHGAVGTQTKRIWFLGEESFTEVVTLRSLFIKIIFKNKNDTDLSNNSNNKCPDKVTNYLKHQSKK